MNLPFNSLCCRVEVYESCLIISHNYKIFFQNYLSGFCSDIQFNRDLVIGPSMVANALNSSIQ